MRRLLAPILLLLLAAACGGEPTSSTSPEAAAAPVVPGPLHLRTADGLAAVDPETGQVDFQQPGAMSSPDGAVVARAQSRPDGTTRLSWVDPETGARLRTADVEGAASVRVVAPDGRVALGPAVHVPAEVIGPDSRSRTRLTVADADGTLHTFGLAGNIEPEAFSTDGASLFVLDYTPALAPTQYQVRRLDLATGELGTVAGPDGPDGGQERMAATARTQTWSPDGKVVYTLYSTHSDTGAPVSFVHVLNVEEGWAYCLGLDQPIGSITTAALTVSPDSSRLWVTDATGIGAVIDTDDLAVLRMQTFTPPGDYGLAAASDGERLFVGSGNVIQVLDGADLTPIDTWRTTRSIVDLRLAPGRDRLVAVTDGQLTTFPLAGADTATIAGLDLPFTDPVAVIMPTVPYIECAC